MIFGLSLITFLRLKKVDFTFDEIELPKIEMPERKIEDFLPLEKEGEKEWLSPDQKLKLTYSLNWTNLREAFFERSEEKIMVEEFEFLLLAQRLNLQNNLSALLTVYKVAGQESLEEFIENLKEFIKSQSEQTEINIVEEENFVWVEFTSKEKEQTFYSKGKVIIREETAYLVLISAQEESWSFFKQEIQEIFDSVQILP